MATGNNHATSTIPSLQWHFRDALEDFKKDLKKQGTRNHIQATTLDELKAEIDKVQTQQHSRRTMQNFERLRGFLEATEQFGKVIEVYCQVHEIVAFIWGPLKFLLQIANAHVEAIREIIGAYQDLGSTMCVLRQSWELHPKDAHLGSVLVQIYKGILEFHLKALHYFKKPTWKQVFAATWKTHRATFGDTLDALKDYQDVIFRHTSMAEFRSNRQERERHVIEKRGERNEQHFKELRTWLQGADVDNHHHRLRNSQTPGTGRWLFSNEKFKRWFDPTSPYSLLWMNGLPGAGKSVLASMVVHEAQANVHNYNPKPKVLYFYCKEGDKEANNFIAIGRSLLLQLLSHDSQIIQHLHNVYRDSKDAILRTRQVAEDLLEASLLDCESAYMILDGIDECITEERQGIVHWFKTLVEKLPPANCNRLRVLLVSQSDMRERRDFSGITSLKILPDDNRTDVAEFGKLESKRIQDRFGLSDEIRNDIATRIPESSGGKYGIFLLAKLTCDNLYRQSTREGLNAELQPHVFPRSINGAYTRIMERILSHAEQESVQENCLKLFGWLVCAKRPMKWHEIQGAQAIDTCEQSVDPYEKGFVDSAKELCGSLIETHDDGTIQFIHMTARWFLTEAGHVNLHGEHVKMTELCIDYLNLPGLCKEQTPLDQHIQGGYYSFMDYAMVNWLLHFEAALGKRDDAETSVAISQISDSLETFLEEHWANPVKPAVVANRHIEKLKPFDSAPFYGKLKTAFGWARKMVYSHTGIVPAEVVLDLIVVVTTVRIQIERVWEESQRSSVARLKMEEMYGKSIYKCPRLSCLHFNQGFNTKVLRNEHLDKHERPHRCTMTGCPSSMMGFSKAKDLQKHMEHTHDSLVDASNQFPTVGEKMKQKQPKPKPKPQALDNGGDSAHAIQANTTHAPPQQSQPQHSSTDSSPVTAQDTDNPQTSLSGPISDNDSGEESVPPSPKTPEPDIPPERPVYVQQRRGPRIFECSPCDRTFTKKSNYDSHMRRHSDEKPFSCGYCQLGFARNSDRKRHEKSHVSSQYSCPNCQTIFTRQDSLRNHYRSQIGIVCMNSMQRNAFPSNDFAGYGGVGDGFSYSSLG